ncbi:hypothetical protein SAMN05518683_102316 [Salibacterium halotolerans]|uniref:Uncharacterized protein n=1 Tax=Salibacterium halotolerans TaxID=1884432 RepID=A0A1I5MRI7_9BACI|nr:hypothetical protein SAMN05518683_102316 [Salibacterium halotolerans]
MNEHPCIKLFIHVCNLPYECVRAPAKGKGIHGKDEVSCQLLTKFLNGADMGQNFIISAPKKSSFFHYNLMYVLIYQLSSYNIIIVPNVANGLLSRRSTVRIR